MMNKKYMNNLSKMKKIKWKDKMKNEEVLNRCKEVSTFMSEVEKRKGKLVRICGQKQRSIEYDIRRFNRGKEETRQKNV